MHLGDKTKALLPLMMVAVLFITNSKVFSQNSNKDVKPKWITEDYITSNNSYKLKSFRIQGTSLSEARKKLPDVVSFYMERTFHVSGVTVETLEVENNYSYRGNTTTSNERVIDTVITKADEIKVIMRIVDEYVSENEYYFLCMVPNPNVKNIQYDDIAFTNKYGASGFVRSLIPGWGQMYKGSTAKGGIIIGTEALGIGGIVLGYSMKASYEKLILEDPRNASSYSISADTWTNVTYGCIAFTAAVYIYNLIDAIVAPGARRVILNPNKQGLSLYPVLLPSQNYVNKSYVAGLTLNYKF